MTQQLIYLVAPTGFPNFGDEYIAAAWLRTLARRRPGARVVLDCPNPGSAAVLHAGRHPNLTVTDTLFRVLERAREDAGTEWEDVVARAEDIMRTPHELVRFEAGIRLARAADVVHLLGGGWINDLNPEFAGVAAAASLAGCDAPGGALRAATGQGLAPGAAGTGRLGAVWRRFDVVDVRDDDSFALVDGLPAETNRGVDDAWVALTGGAAGDGPGEGPGDGAGHGPGHGTGDDPAYDGLGHGPGDARDRPIAVCLQGDLLADGPDGPPGADALADAAVATLRAWGATGEGLAVIEAIPGVDRVVWDLVADRAPELARGARFVPFIELWHRGLPARAGQRWLSTRFHPHLIAAARGASGVALDVHVDGYYSVKQGSVVAAGSGWPVTGLADAPGAAPGPGMPRADVDRNRAAKEAIVDRLYPWPTRGMRARARLAGIRGRRPRR